MKAIVQQHVVHHVLGVAVGWTESHLFLFFVRQLRVVALVFFIYFCVCDEENKPTKGQKLWVHYCCLEMSCTIARTKCRTKRMTSRFWWQNAVFCFGVSSKTNVWFLI